MCICTALHSRGLLPVSACDGRAVLSQGNVHADYVHCRENERHGSRAAAPQCVRWKGSSVLASLSVVLKHCWGLVISEEELLHSNGMYIMNISILPWPLSAGSSVELSWFRVAEDVMPCDLTVSGSVQAKYEANCLKASL